MPVSKDIPRTLAECVRLFHGELQPDGAGSGVDAWNETVELTRSALGREPVIGDLTADRLRSIRKEMRVQGATEWTVRQTLARLNQLWKFVSSSDGTVAPPKPKPPSSDAPGSLACWFKVYHAEALPDARPATIKDWDNAVRLSRVALRREPMIDDLTEEGLLAIERRLYDEGKSRWTIRNVTKVLKALWRFVSDRGEAFEIAPKRRMDSRGRIYLGNGRTRMDFDSFAAQVGLTACRQDDLPEAATVSLTLPQISGPRPQDFDRYRREIEASRTAARTELRRLFGEMLFNWVQLYQEYAGISSKARNQWRFALLRFAEYLERPPMLDDLTASNLAGVEAAFARGNLSAGHIARKLRCVWRFAWEVGALVDGPPIKEGNWRLQRWTMHRLGRPSVKVS